MPRGSWSFFQEWVIYEYLSSRFLEGTLRLKLIIKQGKIQRKDKWLQVTYLRPITSTGFPDIESISLKGSTDGYPAEVKFTTSLFNYHKGKYASAFKTFLGRQGIMIVLHHDYVSSGLESYGLNVYEIDLVDFVAFCRENFMRLLNRQIRRHVESKIWIMYQGPNFNKGEGNIKPARESGIWCPTENLSGFDLAERDRVLFIKDQWSVTGENRAKLFIKQDSPSRLDTS